MKTHSLQTIEEIFEFRRPMETYKEMYGMKNKTKQWCQRLGILPTVFFSFLIVIFFGFLFRSVEYTLLADDNSSQHQTEIESGVQISIGELFRNVLGIETAHAAEPEAVVRDTSYRAKYLSQSV